MVRWSMVVWGGTAIWLVGCDGIGKVDACVSEQTFEGQSSPQSYSCDEELGEEHCQTYDDVNVEGHPFTVEMRFYEGTSCEGLGYGYECSYQWLSNSSCDSSIPPGSSGSSGSSGGGGSGSGDCGTSSYGGPYYDDYQVESQCEALWAYGCTPEAQEAICEILDQWEANGVPNVCPYC
jgi:hypothetical protein